MRKPRSGLTTTAWLGLAQAHFWLGDQSRQRRWSGLRWLVAHPLESDPAPSKSLLGVEMLVRLIRIVDGKGEAEFVTFGVQ